MTPSPIREKVERYLRDCLDHRTAPRVSELAHRLQCSAIQLSRAFERETGEALGRYLRERQIEEACELLRSCDDAIVEVATRCGFTTLRSFFRTFRRVTGVTPARYRGEKSVSFQRQT